MIIYTVELRGRILKFKFNTKIFVSEDEENPALF